MISAIINYLLRIRNRDKIPPLPRGMLAAPYERERITLAERRVMLRYGARCPAGVPVAMKRAKAPDVDSLVLRLRHFKPRRFIQRRLNTLIERGLVATRHNPHARQLLEYDRDARRRNDAAPRLMAMLRQLDKESR
jgi:hypothetical protein